MKRVTVLDIVAEVNNTRNVIHPTILEDDNEMILVDCGFSGFFEKVRDAALAKNINLSHLTKIIITHHDYDHIGCLADFIKAYPNVVVIASEKQVPYISGLKESLRVEQAKSIHEFLPEEKKPFAAKLIELFSNVEPVKVNVVVKDGDVLPYLGGIEIIETPGHMPGHISLYLREDKVLIAGDAICYEEGRLDICNPQFTLDMEMAMASIQKLEKYAINEIICYHGGIVKTNIKDLFRDLLTKEF